MAELDAELDDPDDLPELEPDAELDDPGDDPEPEPEAFRGTAGGRRFIFHQGHWRTR